MRLAKIKLAGFKSFVDPTSFRLPSNLIGVVGPNGCGKSNLIDAVRWVMGEASAKHLRGESMADVVFNGSTSRKPVGQASIELVFDNSDGGLGGQYAQYSELGIRRQVSRDGQSAYYLNGARCRRRDITDLFLGTGLGPRSYAIIEQGMISRVVEAKADELRAFIEEAAGISKYKERRRETEGRIRNTRDNLARLEDLREELDKQLQRLQRQARTAERYKALREEEHLLKAQLAALRWRDLQAMAEGEARHTRELEVAHEALRAEQRQNEAALEEARVQHTEASERFNAVQARYYAVGSDVARMEQALQHHRERRSQVQRDLERVERSWREASRHLEVDQGQLREVEEALGREEPALEALRRQEGAAREGFEGAERAMQDWQGEWEGFNARSGAPAQTAEVQRTRIQDLEQHLQRLRTRAGRLDEEAAGLDPRPLEEAVETLAAQLAELEAERVGLDADLGSARAELEGLRGRDTELGREIRRVTGEVHTQRGRLASLEALQQDALGKSAQETRRWLDERDLGGQPRLAERLEVDEGWERAVEVVLGHHLEAVCVADLDPVLGRAEGVAHGTVGLVETRAGAEGATAGTGNVWLRERVRAPWSLESLVSGVRCADTLEQARAARHGLAPGESVVTREGLWLGVDWLRLSGAEDEQAGVLGREREIRALGEALADLESRGGALEGERRDLREALGALESDQADRQRRLNDAHRRRGALESQLGGRRARLEQVHARAQRIQSEQDELRAQRAQDEQELAEARARLETALGEMEALTREREGLRARRDGLQDELRRTRQAWHEARAAERELSIRVESMRSRRESLRAGLERAQELSQAQAARRDELAALLAESEAPIAEARAGLDETLALRVGVEGELKGARAGLEGADEAIRGLESARRGIEERLEGSHARLEQARMAHQATITRIEAVEEQLGAAEAEPRALLQGLTEEATEDQWRGSVEEVERRIGRLGPINLAAIDELAQESERKAYLDSQHQDLVEALATLESVIHKIDSETRTRFRETFEQVNGGLKSIFPRLFGGGHAYLELTGEDLLEAGVSIMARPPGKRNSTIHLLSGGEKALTAVALVFAIFELNPAPFCLLDEVDAPLDDANVGRFCDLVRSMSDRVQFMFITHNKTTMELSSHLVGVTMHEPGVSRLVAVDVDEAVEMATA